MLVTRGYKYTLRVNNKERTLLQQCAGTARISWNWGLAQRLKLYKSHMGNERFTDAMKQHKEINQLKKRLLTGCISIINAFPNKLYEISIKRSKISLITGRKTDVELGFPNLRKKTGGKTAFD
ncbi:MAG: helix-turn-helix domain-containing protein [Candidatus Hodarchaeota archaeon]